MVPSESLENFYGENMNHLSRHRAVGIQSGLRPILRRVDYQPIEPGKELRLKLERADRPRKLDTGVLGDVLGVFLIATPIECHAVHHVVMGTQ